MSKPTHTVGPRLDGTIFHPYMLTDYEPQPSAGEVYPGRTNLTVAGWGEEHIETVSVLLSTEDLATLRDQIDSIIERHKAVENAIRSRTNKEGE